MAVCRLCRVSRPELDGSLVSYFALMRIFIVEDEFLPGILLQEDLCAAGWITLGPYPTLSQAMSAAVTEQFDLAVLDINLNGEMVYPLADELTARRIPFIFLSGYTRRDLPERFWDSPKLSKPYDVALLKDEIKRVAAKRLGGASDQP